MKAILGAEGKKQLAKFAARRTVIVLDYDGTISPIASRTTDAVIRPEMKGVLRRLSRLYPTTVLSGRKLSDISARVRGLGIREVVGNHGLEWRGSCDLLKYEKLMHRCRRVIQKAIDEGRIHGEGIEAEYKKVTLSIHYRQSPHHARAYREILEVLRELPGTQIIQGKCVFNLLPKTRLSKGTAVVALRKKLRCERAIFAGDDWTDEKVFALRSKSFLLDIRVGRAKRSKARYYVPDIDAMEQVLRELIRLRQKPPAQGREKPARPARKTRRRA